MPNPAPRTTQTTPFNNVADYCRTIGQRVRRGSRALATADGALRNRWLEASAEALIESRDVILASNAEDLNRAENSNLTSAQIDRLRLDESRIAAMATSLREVAALPDPIGQIIDGSVRPNGMQVTRVRVPIGVVFMIFESRPNVTVDAAAICVKSGNGVVLRGGKEARLTSTSLFHALRDAAVETGIPTDALQWIERPEHDIVTQFLAMPEAIDLVIPRGGSQLVQHVSAHARMPVIKHEAGNCHVYVDHSADSAMAERIVIDAKCQRPGVCNACESLLIHRDVGSSLKLQLIQSLCDAGVEVRGDERIQSCDPRVLPIRPEDDDLEYLDKIVSARVVESLNDAIEHIGQHSSGHTETIVTEDYSAARRFVNSIDSATVLVNASTRLNDGAELGLGAEIGISTDRIHARGPCGLNELTTYKYVCWGSGQTKGTALT